MAGLLAYSFFEHLPKNVIFSGIRSKNMEITAAGLHRILTRFPIKVTEDAIWQ